MILALFGGLQWSGKIGVGTLVTVGLAVAAVTAYFVKLRNGDAPELRQSLADEVTRRKAADEDRKNLRLELAATRAKTDITGLEDRMTRRMDVFEKAAEKQTEILQGLVEAVQALIQRHVP